MAKKKQQEVVKKESKKKKDNNQKNPKKVKQQLNTQFTPSQDEIKKIDFDVIEQVEKEEVVLQNETENNNDKSIQLQIKLSEEMDSSINELKPKEQVQKIIEDNIPKKIISYYGYKDTDEEYKGKVYHQGKYYDSAQIFISQFQLSNKKLPKACYPVQEINLEIKSDDVLKYLFKDNIKFIEQHKLQILITAFNKFNQCNSIFNKIQYDNYLKIKFREQN